MKSIIAGMGIGGLAFAFAAKDTIANLFGSITVLLDKPFQIGDLINIGGNIEGVVEQVGIRSTRVRTLYDSLITVPNGTLTSSHIDNWGRRNSRRWKTTLGVQYDTSPQKLEAFCEGIRELIKKNEYIRQDNYRVFFNAFSASSLDILIYLFWKVPGWDEELIQKHKMSIEILELANEMGVSFAFPTQTVHLFNEDNSRTL
jgi:MscS family membrane protein